MSSRGFSAAKAARGRQLAQARAQQHASSQAVDDSSSVFNAVQDLSPQTLDKLAALQQTVATLEISLQAERQVVADLVQALQDEKQQFSQLSAKLDDATANYEECYHALRVERRAGQRGQQRKTVLEEQIKALKAMDLQKYDDIRRLTTKASEAIDAKFKIEKENVALQSELMGILKRCAADVTESQEKLKDAAVKLKASQREASCLKKQFKCSAALTERAIQRAKTQAHKEYAVHDLFHKGVYKEDTRNLIRMLVQSGCSRQHVGEIIHAVLRVAGITVKGDVSRRTISRVIQEGYYAAQVQLGYEMEKAKSMFNFSWNFCTISQYSQV